ncbi:Uncharacterised protein [Legionella lansingensis]|uniref:Uncharacterized protein n=1 Tax=Legionella lansingensis TaxID=45067 RepID=A0A0W0VVA7_9GAMM|nr:hypothetical protein [Legionella lansingensis]KTD23905.1 hypothetical protein Llan_0686 [Legionella lansingensis]SNV46371.1 Uncharacterised protein [Legionella lansingensis]
MKWYTDILHKMVDDYFSKHSQQSQDSSLVKANIDQTIQALEKLFASDGEIPIETLIGLVHNTFNLLNTTDKLTSGDISQKVLGYAIIFAKTACDQAIWTIDFTAYHPIKNVKTLNKYEQEALQQLDFNTNINLSVIQTFESILNKYATHQDKLQLVETIATYNNKGLLGDLYKNLRDQTRHPLVSRFLNQENLIDDHIKNGTGEAKGLTIGRLLG